ncbi:MAG: DUF2442 domain-containing protein [Prevotellaceae bacterium]|jgi:hypothetical protein|nr:DUF2442 domain-containing protein [Prevotellaceae bacterium]
MDARIYYIVSATYIENYTVRLTFNDGTTRDIDFGRFLKSRPHPQHSRYLNYNQFKKFHLEHGNIVWGKNSDLIFDEYDLYLGKNPC